LYHAVNILDMLFCKGKSGFYVDNMLLSCSAYLCFLWLLDQSLDISSSVVECRSGSCLWMNSFEGTIRQTEGEAWVDLRNVIDDLLVNSRDKNYKIVVEKMVNKF
jgi:hypothetical protein